MLGLDAARRGYWSAYGGTPGMAYLLGDFSQQMDAAGITALARRRMFVENPARAFAFQTSGEGGALPEPGSPSLET